MIPALVPQFRSNTRGRFCLDEETDRTYVQIVTYMYMVKNVD